MNSNTGQLIVIRELCKKVVSTYIGDIPLVVSGSAPLDLMLQRVPKDLDVYYLSDYDSIMTPERVSALLTCWGVGRGLNNTPLNVNILDNEYGTHTLRYDISGEFQGYPVQIQFISMNSDKCRDRMSYMLTAEHKLHAVCDTIVDSFPVNTSRNVLHMTPFGCLAVHCRMSLRVSPDDAIHLHNIEFTEDASPKLVAKCIDKYMKHCERPFKKVGSISTYSSRTVILPDYTTECVMLNATLLGNEVVISEPKTFDSLPDPKSSTKFTIGHLSSMSTADPTRPSSARPLPQDGLRQGSVAQELQSARVQSQEFIPTFRGSAISERSFDEFIEAMARGTPSIPAS